MTQFASTPHNALIDAYQALTALQRARVQEGEVNTALARDLKALPAPFTANVKAIQAQLRDVRICRMICYNSEDSVFAISAKALDMIAGVTHIFQSAETSLIAPTSILANPTTHRMRLLLSCKTASLSCKKQLLQAFIAPL